MVSPWPISGGLARRLYYAHADFRHPSIKINRPRRLGPTDYFCGSSTDAIARSPPSSFSPTQGYTSKAVPVRSQQGIAWNRTGSSPTYVFVTWHVSSLSQRINTAVLTG